METYKIYNMGIYSITNKINGKRYIGKSENIKGRWKGHKSELRHNKHHCEHLQLAWNKYGEDSFVFEKICEVWDVNNLRKIEQTFIDLYKSYDGRFGYNEERYADERKIVSEETKRKISKALKGKMTGENHPMFGKHHTEETKKKISLAHSGEKHCLFGKHIPEETKKKMSEAQKGERGNNFGKHPSEDTRKKMSLVHGGEKHHMFGKHHSEDTRKKMSENHADFSGENSANSKLTWIKAQEIREKYATGNYSQMQLAKEYGVQRPCIWKVIHFQSWIIKEDTTNGQQ
jgi:group I intron endonuclease